MKNIIMYTGSGLIGAITTIFNLGYIKLNGQFNLLGCIINLVSVSIWIIIVHMIFDK